MKKFIIINQRIDKIGKFKEKRDNLDSRFTKFITEIGMMPLLIPNNRKFIKSFLSANIKINGIILSPGGDPRKKDARSFVEDQLIRYAVSKKLPLLGICRGAQKLNLYFGGKISKVNGHVRKNHRVFGKILSNKIVKINSFHDYGITRKNLSKKFNVLLSASDGVIESFCNKKGNLLGIMWHPERYPKIRNFEKKLIKKFFKCN